MAFFKFRKGGDEQTVQPAQPENVEVLRRRAKNRLIGAAILVMAGVVGFPLLVDKQPRPVAVDLPIEIPDKNRALPLAPPEPPKAPPAAAPEPTASAPAPAPAATGEPKTPRPEPAATHVKPEVKSAVQPEAKTAKAVAKPEGKSGNETRYVVQVGSFAEEARAREVRQKLERAGLKSYTQVVETKDGRRVRVRVGPFANRSEADRAAEKCKKLGLPNTVLGT